MRYLKNADSLFLNIEQPECPMNMGLLAILSGPDDEDSITRLVQVINSGALSISSHYNKLSSAESGIRQPCWVHDDDLDVDMHIKRHSLQTPGARKQLDAVIEDVLMTPLDRTNSLWEIHYVTGLQDRKIAVILKLHHACADGLNALKMFSQSLSSPPLYQAEMVRNANRELDSGSNKISKYWLINPLRLMTYFLLAPFIKAYVKRLSPNTLNIPPQATRFTGAVGKQRSYGTLSLPLNTFRIINRKYKSSDNEILMSIYSGALNRYLSEKDELPSKSLHAGLPISQMNSRQYSGANNQIGFYRVSMATKNYDPVQRLELMKNRCEAALKKEPSKIWRRIQTSLPFAPPKLIAMAARAYSQLIRQKRIFSTLSAVVTYMPGPVRVIKVADHVVEGAYPLSVLFHGCGLSLSAMRYGQSVDIGVASDREMMPDPDLFIAYLSEEFNALAKTASD